MSSLSSPAHLLANTPSAPIEGVRSSARALAISKALRDISRRTTSRVGRLKPSSTGKASYSFRWFVGIGFVLLVFLPAVISGIYLAAIASNQYVSEAQFAVRSGGGGLSIALPGLAQAARLQDALLVEDYIKSSRMFEELDRRLDLRKAYGRGDIDFLYRLSPNKPIEDVVSYWQNRVDVRVDHNSGIVTVTVRAFTANDSLAIARAIVDLSERLVNELSERARQDALRYAKDELGASVGTLQNSIEQLRNTRNSEGVLDAQKAAEAATGVIAILRTQLLGLRGEYDVGRRTLTADAPQMKLLESRIRILEKQIKEEEVKIGGAGRSTTLSDAQSRLEKGTIEQHVAEQQFAAAAIRFQRARLDADAQQMYVVTFVPPRLAQDALYPRRIVSWLIVMAGGLALWGLLTGVGVLVRNHIAI